MKLLIVTQAVDSEDPVLGFFVRWIDEFAKQAEHIEVICLKEGKHRLPPNVHVHSLGKEHCAASRSTYARRFLSLIRQLRNSYDTVLVHMNPEYVMLGAAWWGIYGKKIAFWYNHPNNDVRFKIAATLAHTIFYTSPYAAPARLAKAIQMPVGIDTKLFAPQRVTRDRNSIYMQGRIAPSKRVHILLQAVRLLHTSGVPVTLTLVGPEDETYGRDLRKTFSELVEAGVVSLVGERKNEETPDLYSAHGVAVNLASAGHFDKSAFEPMACETPVIVSSIAFKGIVPDDYIVTEGDPASLADALRRVVTLSEGAYITLGKDLREVVVKRHSLSSLADRLFGALVRVG